MLVEVWREVMNKNVQTKEQVDRKIAFYKDVYVKVLEKFGDLPK